MRLLWLLVDAFVILFIAGVFYAVFNAGKLEGKEEVQKRKKVKK